MNDGKIRLQRLKIERQLLANELKKEYDAGGHFQTYDALVQNNLYTEHECGLESDFTKKAKRIRDLDEEICRLEGQNPFYLWNAPLVHLKHLVKTGKIQTEKQIQKTAKFAAYLERKRVECEQFHFSDTTEQNKVLVTVDQELPASEVIKSKIETGENITTEFKSTLRWNIKTKVNDPKITHACLKTIAAFLNSKGGTLLIGVDNSRNVTGIELDRYGNNDKFVNALYNYIRDSISQEAATLVEADVHLYQGVGVCLVRCLRSSKPVFLQFKGCEEEFFVRTGPSTIKLTASQIHEYISTKFKSA